MGIVKHIPNTITSMNLLCGVLGVICTFKGSYDTAFIWMLAAAACDFCDGLSARLLKAYSDLGKELDSLADMVSFGVLPALMMNRLMADIHGDSLLCYIPLLIAVFSALRLAKFNIDERQSDNFIGLATPACAMICGSFAYYVSNDPTSVLYTWAGSRLFIPIGSVILSLLLISEIPMFSMKFKKNIKPGTPIHKQRIGFAGVIFVATALTILLGLNWSMIVLLTFTSYVVMNIGIALLFKKK
ncbi:MAG: CDP-diacylglycerol--serine O-phosphatidyltransferase [Bacteroidales bacterium]|nr:CDP-diacylglycerol--serine O-phosphatidyltransferase [Bacteroidales bacterium]